MVPCAPRVLLHALKVHRAPNGTYEGALAVLSPDLVLFLKRDVPSIELCRVTSARGRGSSDRATQDAASEPSLRVVRTLALPAFNPGYRVHTAYMQTDRRDERRRHLKTPQQQQQEGQHPTRAPAPLTFHSAPEDMVVGITFLLRLRGPRTHWKKVVTTISHRALFELAADRPNDGDTIDDSDDDEDDGSGSDSGGEEEGGLRKAATGVGVPVPWKKWGPRAARVILPSNFQWITAHAGQRWLSLEADKLVIRDFSTVRVRRARAQARGPADARNDDSDGGAAPAQTFIQGGSTCFKEDVMSELPFLETSVDARGRAGDMVLTDGERLLAFVGVVSSKLFFFHFHNFSATKRPKNDILFLKIISYGTCTGPTSEIRHSRARGSRPGVVGPGRPYSFFSLPPDQIAHPILHAWRSGSTWERNGSACQLVWVSRAELYSTYTDADSICLIHDCRVFRIATQQRTVNLYYRQP